MASNKLSSLEARMDILENRVFGASDKDIVYPKCIDSLATINSQLYAALVNRGKADAVLKRFPELEKYLDSEYPETLSLPQDAKADIILAEEDQIRKQAEDLEKVQNLNTILNSEHIKVVPALSSKFQELSKIQIQQQDETGSITEEVKRMLLHYNSIVTLLTKQFIKWDEILTHLEQDAQPKKTLD